MFLTSVSLQFVWMQNKAKLHSSYFNTSKSTSNTFISISGSGNAEATVPVVLNMIKYECQYSLLVLIHSEYRLFWPDCVLFSLQINSSSVVGENAVVFAQQTVMGGLYIRSLRGDFLREWELKPQVKLWLTACRASACPVCTMLSFWFCASRQEFISLSTCFVLKWLTAALFYYPVVMTPVAASHSVLDYSWCSSQVEVYINGIASKCSGDCGFEWSEEKTPVVTGISPSQGELWTYELLYWGNYEEDLVQNTILFAKHPVEVHKYITF